MNRRDVEIGAGRLTAYGHWGRPLLAFPSQQGHRSDYEQNGMIDAVAGLIDAGRVKVYCVDSYDSWSWHDERLPLEERARRHGFYEDWITNQVAPWIHGDCDGGEIILTGSSFGAYHSANFSLKRAELFPLAICLSGVYDVATVGWGERGDSLYFNNPAEYVANLHGDQLDWLRGRVSLVLVVGQGSWEDSTGARESTVRFAELLAGKGIAHELDVWGHDVPHDWPSWRLQIAHHLPRFV